MDNPSSPAADSGASPSAVRPDVLELLRCPVTRSPLHQEGDWLIAEVGGLRYPVRDGIPVMLPEEAQLPPGVANLDDFRARFGIPRR